ncbi:MAG: hypothetical protein ACKOD2_05260 [Ilumatobacteraceae bacterium]
MIRLRAGAAAVVAAAASIAVLVAAEVSVAVAAWTVALVAWSTLAGIRAARWCGFADARPLDRVAVGYALGLFATLVIDQLFVTGLGVAWRWTAPAVLAPLALGEAVVLARSAMGARVSPAVGLVVAGGALLAVGHEWIWSLPLGGAALAAAWLCTERGRGARLSLQLGLLATSAAGTVVALVRRDGRWWLTQNDTFFFEAIVRSLSDRGVRDFTLASGRMLQYHWFSFGWAAAVSRVGSIPDFVALTRLGPLVGAIGVMISVVSIAERFVTRQHAAWATAGFAMSSVYGDWWIGIPLAMGGSYGQSFTLAWLMAWLVALLRWLESRERRALLCLAALAIALVGGKANHAVIAGVLWISTALLGLRGEWRKILPLWWSGAVTAMAMAVVGRGLVATTQSLQFLPFDWVAYVQGDLYLAPAWLRAFGWVSFMAAMVTASVVGLAGLRATTLSTLRLRAPLQLTLIAGAAMTMMGSRFGQHWGPNGLYFLHSAVALVLAVVIPATVQEWSESVAVARWRVVALALITWAVVLMSPDLNSGSTMAVLLRVLRSALVVLPLIVLRVTTKSTAGGLRDRKARGAVVMVILLVIVQVTITIKSIPDSYRTWRQDDEQGALVADSTEGQVASWIRSSTAGDAIVATNHLCNEVACPDPDYSGDAAFAVSSARRFLVAAPLFSSVYTRSSATPSMRDRVQLSVEFGQSPTVGLAATLRAAGVRWYVAERARSEGVDFSDVGDVRYENADYLVVELRDP